MTRSASRTSPGLVAAKPPSSYEQSLPRVERRQWGKFYTPPEIAAYLLDSVGYRVNAPIEQELLLDPACGTGNFLVVAAHILVARCRHLGWPAGDILAAVQHNLHGYDLDEAACHLAILTLRQEVLTPLAEEAGCDSAAFALNIMPIDVLLHHHPDTAEGSRYDYVVGNPPYLARKNADLSRYQALAPDAGQGDTYLLFVALAYRLLRSGGRLGLLLPDPFLIRRNAGSVRQMIVDQMTLLRLVHLRNIFAAGVSNVLVIARKESPAADHSLQVAQNACRRQGPRFIMPALIFQSCPQALFQQQPLRELRYRLIGNLAAIVAKIGDTEHHQYAPLEALLSICRGEEVGRSTAALTRDPQAGLPVLRGGQDLDRYRCTFSGWYLPEMAVRKPLSRYQQPKLLVVKSTGRLKVALDTENCVVLQTLYLLHPKAGPLPHQTREVDLLPSKADPTLLSPHMTQAPRGATASRTDTTDTTDTADGRCIELHTHPLVRRESSDPQDLRYLLALLNSPLLRTYLQIMTTAYKLVQPQIEQDDLRRLPLRAIPARDQAPFIALVDELRVLPVSETGAWRHLERQLDQLTAELYELTPKEKLRVEANLS